MRIKSTSVGMGTYSKSVGYLLSLDWEKPHRTDQNQKYLRVNNQREPYYFAVSYTHLTLPTTAEV